MGGAFWFASSLMAKQGLMGGRTHLVMEGQRSWEDGDSHSVIAHSLVTKADFWGQHQWKLGVRSVSLSCSPSWGLPLRPSSQSVGFCCCLRFALEVTEALELIDSERHQLLTLPGECVYRYYQDLQKMLGKKSQAGMEEALGSVPTMTQCPRKLGLEDTRELFKSGSVGLWLKSEMGKNVS